MITEKDFASFEISSTARPKAQSLILERDALYIKHVLLQETHHALVAGYTNLRISHAELMGLIRAVEKTDGIPVNEEGLRILSNIRLALKRAESF
jgi:hypothetical protein